MYRVAPLFYLLQIALMNNTPGLNETQPREEDPKAPISFYPKAENVFKKQQKPVVVPCYRTARTTR